MVRCGHWAESPGICTSVGSRVTRSMISGLRPGSALLLAAVFWCAMWSSECDPVSAAVPLQRTDSGVLLRRQDLPHLSTFRSSALLKRSRRISRTSPARFANTGGFSPKFSKSLKSSDFRQPCSHVGDLTNDIAARAFLAGTVFEGKARSRSAVREPGGVYAVTFSVQHVHKDRGPGAGALRLRSQVRLQFREKTGGRAGPCVQDYNYTSVEGPVRANIKRGGKYLVFVSGVGPHNFTVIGEPVFRSKKNLQAVRDVLCHDCGEYLSGVLIILSELNKL